jgi:phenylacetate-CoA ligase
MLIIRGVNVFPSQIENELLKNPNVRPHYHINVDRVNNLDVMEIVVELAPDVAVDEVAHVEEIRKKLAANMASALSVSAKITLVSPGTVQRSEGKSKRITDNRKY